MLVVNVCLAQHLMTTSMDEVLAEPGMQVVFEAIVNEEPAYSY